MILKNIIEAHNIFYKLGFDEYSQEYIMEIDNGQGIKNYYVISEDEYEESRNNSVFMNMLYDECLKEKEDIYVLGNTKLSVIYQDEICVKVEEIKINV